MTQAKTGDTVRIHYTGRLKDGTVFDSSEGRAPLEFQLGSGMVIPGFDRGVTGMVVGDKKQIDIPAAEAYGPHQPENMLQVPRTDMPSELDPQVGMQLQMAAPTGEAFLVTVTDVTAETVTLDGNHPLAGQDLIFDLELVAIG